LPVEEEVEEEALSLEQVEVAVLVATKPTPLLL
jgi:hypothetical protein